MKPEEVQRLLLHADAYAFGMLVIEILTGYFPLLRYKDGDKKTLTNTNVELEGKVKSSGVF